MSLTVKILEKQSGTLTKTAHAWLGGLITSETDGYTGVNATITHNSTTHRWRVVGTGGTSVSLQYDTAVACSVGDVIFTTARVRVLTDGVDNIYARVDGTTAGSLSVASQASPVADTYYDLYGTATITGSETGNIRLRWWFYDASGATDTVMQVERWTAINLTDQFGAGDEPSAADLQAFFEWRWELMTYPNYALYDSAGYGDGLYYASKIASHGLEYNDIVHFSTGFVYVYEYFSPVYVLNTDWIITGWYVPGPGGTFSQYEDETDYSYWTKTDYTSSVMTKTLQLNMREDIDGYARMTFKADTDWQPQLGMTVIIFDDAETLFTGHITNIRKTTINATHWLCDVECRNLLSTLQWNIFDGDDTWNALDNPNTGAIVEYLVMSYAGPVFINNTAGQGIWYGNIEAGNSSVVTRDSAYKTVWELINSLCTNAGQVVKITGDRRIKCESALSTPADAPFNVTDAVVPRVWDLAYSEDISEYGEGVIFRGGYDANGAPVIVWRNVATRPLTDDIFGAYANKNTLISDNNVTNTTDAESAADAVLQRQGLIIPGTLTFTTSETGFRPGQKLTVDINRLGLSERYMHVDDVMLYDSDGKNLLCNVTCSNRDASSFAAAPNKGPTAYMSELSSKVTQSVSAVQQSAGSFTPTLYGATTAGTWAYTTQEGYYIRIGNVCYISIRLNPSSISGAVGSLLVGGLPFAASSAATRYHLSAFATGLAWGTSMTQLQMPVTGGEQFGYLYGSANNAAWTAVGVADISTGDEIRISGVYLV